MFDSTDQLLTYIPGAGSVRSRMLCLAVYAVRLLRCAYRGSMVFSTFRTSHFPFTMRGPMTIHLTIETSQWVRDINIHPNI